MAGTIIADTIQATSQQISLNVGNTTILTASSTGLTLIPTTNVNINVTNSIVNLTSGNVSRPGLTFSGNTSTGMYMPLANTIAFTAANTESMRIDSAGNVGIGTTSPAVKLHVSGGTQRIQSTGSTTNAFLTLQNDVGTQAILGIISSGNSPANNFYIETNAGKTVYVDASGNLILRRSAQVNSATMTCSASQNSRQISFVNNNNNNETGYIFCLNDGTSTQYATTSDYRLKENVTPMTGALSVVAQLKPVTYKWKLNGSHGQGFIAHELQAVVPDCVSGVKDEIEIQKDENGNDKTVPKYQGVDTSYLVATLTAAIQELKVIVDAQAVEIAALKAK